MHSWSQIIKKPNGHLHACKWPESDTDAFSPFDLIHVIWYTSKTPTMHSFIKMIRNKPRKQAGTAVKHILTYWLLTANNRDKWWTYDLVGDADLIFYQLCHHTGSIPTERPSKKRRMRDRSKSKPDVDLDAVEPFKAQDVQVMETSYLGGVTMCKPYIAYAFKAYL